VGDITALVGANDAGKSSLLEALAIFFDEAKLDSEDACIWGQRDDLSIICEFEDLPTSLVIDADHPTDLRTEHLLNLDGRLEVHKVFNGALKTPKLSGIYANAIHPTIDGATDLLTLTTKELKDRAAELEINLDGVDKRINTLLRRQIWDSFDDLNRQSKFVPLDEADAGKIWDQLRGHLPTFALFKSDRESTDQDSEAQDPMISAVKEALKKQDDALKQITDYVRREVKAIADSTIDKLREIDEKIAAELNPKFGPESWDKVFKISLTGDEAVPINKRGSGVRRLILLSFFRAKAERRQLEQDSPSVIYAVEEPETSQHPKNQRMLMEAFEELSDRSGCQVLISTHTPVMAKLLPLKAIRYLQVGENKKRILLPGNDQTYQIVAKELGVLTDHDVRLFIGVEGPNDIKFLNAICDVLRTQDPQVPNLSALEKIGAVIFIPMGGQNLLSWTFRLQKLNRPEFHILDRDTVPPMTAKYQAEADEINGRPNCRAVITSKLELENYLHPTAIQTARPEIEVVFGNFDDVPKLVAQVQHAVSETEVPWGDLEPNKQKKKIDKAKSWLSSEVTPRMTIDLLDERDPDGEIRGWFATIRQVLNS
jgi:energy-coupling factor transporter ATP-binding protein EcfA2